MAIGGGAGTLSEMALAWQFRRPIVALESDGWSGKLAGERFDERDRHNGLGESDQVWPAADAEEAISLVIEHIDDHTARPTPFG